MAKHIEFWTLLRLTQEYISQHYASALTDKNKLNQLKSYIDKYLRDNDYHVENLTTKELIDKLYCEMAEYSVLTPFLGSPDLEEINVNGWDDIALTYLDGSIVKLKDHFHSPQHAVDIFATCEIMYPIVSISRPFYTGGHLGRVEYVGCGTGHWQLIGRYTRT